MKVFTDVDQKIAYECVQYRTWAQLNARNSDHYGNEYASGGIVRGGHIDYVENEPRGYAYAWLNEPGIYTDKGVECMSIGDVYRSMKHNDAWELINLDTKEVVLKKIGGCTWFYPNRCIYSIRRKDYANMSRRKYDYLFSRELHPFARRQYRLGAQ